MQARGLGGSSGGGRFVFTIMFFLEWKEKSKLVFKSAILKYFTVPADFDARVFPSVRFVTLASPHDRGRPPRPEFLFFTGRYSCRLCDLSRVLLFLLSNLFFIIDKYSL